MEKKHSVSFLELLTLAFIILKLTGKIDWSWWWVLSPILIPIGILVAALVVAVPIFWLRRKSIDMSLSDQVERFLKEE